ncbi:unnamed protein product [Moneuplotes crassus]|uniref:CSC1/OSCA1-like cytosolic domain-containing protein n=1 Tax=Euplotes crassus TaxID=5936 RepID=A0AAD2D792_EUPCR|nr:unnamed protein product [Moneuplotes crassus]
MENNTCQDSEGEMESDNNSEMQHAKEEAEKTKICDENGKRYPICSTPLSKIRNYGLGFWLYMLFLKSIAVISVILSILVTPVVVTNGIVNGVPSDERNGLFDRFCLASHTNEEKPQNFITDEKLAGDIVLFTDVLYSLTFALCILILHKYFNKRIDEAEYELTFMNDYSVEIKGIPKNGFTDQQLIEYLQPYGGRVVEINYARYFGNMLIDYKKLSELNKKIALGGKNKLKLTEKQSKLAQSILQKYPNDTCIKDLDKLWAYAVFENPKKKTRAIAKFSYANRRKLWEYDVEKKKYRFCVATRKFRKFLGKHRIHLKTAPDPTEIIWENLEITSKNRCCRRFIVFAVVGVLLLIGGMIIYSIRASQDKMSDTNSWRTLNTVNSNDIGKRFKTQTLMNLIISIVIFGINELIELTFVTLV